MTLRVSVGVESRASEFADGDDRGNFRRSEF
jgi:hypothetical protein